MLAVLTCSWQILIRLDKFGGRSIASSAGIAVADTGLSHLAMLSFSPV